MIYLHSFIRSDNNPNYENESKEYWSRNYSENQALGKSAPYKFLHSHEEWAKIIEEAFKSNHAATLPDWITYSRSVVPNTEGATLKQDTVSFYIGDGDSTYSEIAWFYNKETQKVEEFSLRGYSDYYGYTSRLSVDTGPEYNVHTVVVDATEDMIVAANNYEAAVKAEHERIQEESRRASLRQSYSCSAEDGFLVVAKSGYKPRSGSNNKQSFSKGTLAIKFWSGSNNWGISYGLKLYDVASKDRSIPNTLFAPANKFEAFVPSIEVKRIDDYAVEIDDGYGMIGKFLSAFLFKALVSNGSSYEGRNICLAKFDKMICLVLKSLVAKQPKILADNFESFYDGGMTNQYDWERTLYERHKAVLDKLAAAFCKANFAQE
jgi:hypothetical protein